MWRDIARTALLAVVGGLLLVDAAPAAPLPSVNAVVTMDTDFFGCRSLDDLTHVVNLDWVKNDKDASTAYGKHNCIVLQKGDQYRVQDVSAVRGAVRAAVRVG